MLAGQKLGLETIFIHPEQKKVIGANSGQNPHEITLLEHANNFYLFLENKRTN